MKKLIAILAIILASLTFEAYSETKTTLNGTEFVSTKGANDSTKTKYTWRDTKGNVYPIYVSKRGKAYVVRKSAKTGNEYKYYNLPKEVKERVEKECRRN